MVTIADERWGRCPNCGLELAHEVGQPCEHGQVDTECVGCGEVIGCQWCYENDQAEVEGYDAGEDRGLVSMFALAVVNVAGMAAVLLGVPARDELVGALIVTNVAMVATRVMLRSIRTMVR